MYYFHYTVTGTLMPAALVTCVEMYGNRQVFTLIRVSRSKPAKANQSQSSGVSVQYVGIPRPTVRTILLVPVVRT